MNQPSITPINSLYNTSQSINAKASDINITGISTNISGNISGNTEANVSSSSAIFSGTSLTANDFDINKFNIQFEKKQRESQPHNNIINTEVTETKMLHQYTIGELFKDYVTSLINIIDELVLFRYNNLDDFLNIFMKNNRLLYIGITILLLALFAFLFRNS